MVHEHVQLAILRYKYSYCIISAQITFINVFSVCVMQCLVNLCSRFWTMSWMGLMSLLGYYDSNFRCSRSAYKYVFNKPHIINMLKGTKWITVMTYTSFWHILIQLWHIPAYDIYLYSYDIYLLMTYTYTVMTYTSLWHILIQLWHIPAYDIYLYSYDIY